MNPGLPTGEIEVRVASAELLSAARTPPFEIESGEGHEVDETLRLKYRYLDIRRAPMLARLELRHRAATAAREYLNARRFLEIETPMLTRSSPEGARDFLVPSRLQPAQLLRAAAVPPDVQADPHGGRRRPLLPARPLLPRRRPARGPPARTHPDRHRDVVHVGPRDPRAARGPHGGHRRGRGGGPLELPLPTLTYDDAMLRYGSDKPDLRYGFEIVELSDVLGVGEFPRVPRSRRRRRRGARHPRAGRRPAVARPARRPHRGRQGARRARHGLCDRRRGPRAARADRQVPVRR